MKLFDFWILKAKIMLEISIFTLLPWPILLDNPIPNVNTDFVSCDSMLLRKANELNWQVKNKLHFVLTNETRKHTHSINRKYTHISKPNCLFWRFNLSFSECATHTKISKCQLMLHPTQSQLVYTRNNNISFAYRCRLVVTSLSSSCFYTHSIHLYCSFTYTEWFCFISFEC